MVIDQLERDTVCKEIEVFFHCAATLRFNEELRFVSYIRFYLLKFRLKNINNWLINQIYIGLITLFSIENSKFISNC